LTVRYLYPDKDNADSIWVVAMNATGTNEITATFQTTAGTAIIAGTGTIAYAGASGSNPSSVLPITGTSTTFSSQCDGHYFIKVGTNSWNRLLKVLIMLNYELFEGVYEALSFINKNSGTKERQERLAAIVKQYCLETEKLKISNIANTDFFRISYLKNNLIFYIVMEGNKVNISIFDRIKQDWLTNESKLVNSELIFLYKLLVT